MKRTLPLITALLLSGLFGNYLHQATDGVTFIHPAGSA